MIALWVLWIGVALAWFLLGSIAGAAITRSCQARAKAVTRERDEQTRAAAAKWHELDAALRGRGWINVTVATVVALTPRLGPNLNYVHSEGYPQPDNEDD